MESKRAVELGTKIMELQSLMVAFVTDGRTPDQPSAYRDLYAEVTIELEDSKYANPNPHKSLEVFWAFCKPQKLSTYN